MRATGADQIAAAIGSRYHSPSLRPKPCRVRNPPRVRSSPSGGCLEVAQAGPVEARRMSSSMRTNAGRSRLRALGQQCFHRAATILQRAVGDAGRERHRAGLGRHAEMGEQPRQERVGVLVVDHESRCRPALDAVDGRPRRCWLWPPRRGLGLEDRDGMSAIQQPGCGKAGNAGADDSNPHEMSLLSSPRWAPPTAGRTRRRRPAGRVWTHIGLIVLRAVPLRWINGVVRKHVHLLLAWGRIRFGRWIRMQRSAGNWSTG